MKKTFRSLAFVLAAALLLAPGLYAQAALTAQPQPPQTAAAALSQVCDITGYISDMKKVAHAQWQYNVPSRLETPPDVIMSITLEKRTPHSKKPGTPDCGALKAAETRVYKLCSATPVQVGDRIQGTEGMATGSTHAVGCLFDLVVLPKS